MKATDLRIGNSFMWNNEFVIINMIRGNDVGIYDENKALISTVLDNIKPIPLTEDWLIRFGFKEKHLFESVSEWRIDEHKIQCDGEIFIWMGYKDGVQLYFVHQLQNLYFALTGSELEAKHKEG